MSPSIPIPLPIPFPNGTIKGPGAIAIHHRDTESESHCSIANTKTRRHKDTTRIENFVFLVSWCLCVWDGVKTALSLRELSSDAPEIGARQ
jgi:hypothetical protein